MKAHRHLGVYGIIIKDGKIVLIDKASGPYQGQLDLPGGSIEYLEKPEDALKREFLEEVGIRLTAYELYDCDSVNVIWEESDINTFNVHHIGIFYIINSFDGEIKEKMLIDSKNDDSLGGKWYIIDKLNRNDLSAITILVLEKLGYQVK